MHKKSLIALILFFVIFTLSSLGYFLYYYHLLDLNFSLKAVAFIVLFSLCILSLLYVSSSLWWHSIVAIFVASLIFFGLINFVHIDIFNTFAPVGIGGTGGLHTILETIGEFYRGVPILLYILSGIYLIIFMILSIVLPKRWKCEHTKIGFCSQKIDIPHHKKYIFACIKSVVVLCIFGVSFFAASYVQTHPREGWWQQNYMVSDLGVPGYIFSVLGEVIIPQHLSGETAYANSIVQSMSTVPLVYDEVTEEASPALKNDTPENYYDYLRYYLKKLDHPYASYTDEISIPDFSSSSPHILIYQLESIGSWGINHDPSPMPYFKQRMEDTVHVEHFFANGCHTIDAEFATLCGFYPDPSTVIADIGTEIKFNACLPDILKKEKGYKTAVFHVNDTLFWNRHLLDPKWGFDNLFFAPEAFPDQKLDDFLPLEKAIDYMKKSDKPVFAQVISIVSHTYHTEQDLRKIEKQSKVKIPRFTGSIDAEIEKRNIDLDEENMRIYFAYLQAVDNDIKFLFEKLAEENLIDHTIVVIVNDHRLYNFIQSDKTNFYLYNEIPFMMYVPGMGSLRARDIASHIDIAPSIMELVFGKDYRPPYNYMGTSIFSSDHPNYALSTCMDTVNYVNPYEIIIGNRAANEYIPVWQEQAMGDYEVTKVANALQVITSMIKSMIRGNMLVNN